MTIALQMPDFIAARLSRSDKGIEDETLRTLVCGLYREGRISAPEAMEAVSINSRIEFDNLIAEHQGQREWPDSEVDLELSTINRLNR